MEEKIKTHISTLIKENHPIKGYPNFEKLAVEIYNMVIDKLRSNYHNMDYNKTECVEYITSEFLVHEIYKSYFNARSLYVKSLNGLEHLVDIEKKFSQAIANLISLKIILINSQ